MITTHTLCSEAMTIRDNHAYTSEETVTETQVAFVVDSTKLELQSSLLATRKSLAEAEQNLTDLKTTYPLDIQTIVDAQLKIKDFKDGIKIIESLQKEFKF